MRDIFFHTQWCAALAMVAVQWPEFICNHLFLALSSRLPFSDAHDQIPFSRKRHGQPYHTVCVVNIRTALW
jgi:hypothetical protein